MSACQYGSPIVLSWPHFYDSDEMNGKVKVFEITNLEKILGISIIYFIVLQSAVIRCLIGTFP